jgi:hypothetical protein
MPEPRRLLAKDGMDYFREHYSLVLRAVLITTGIACFVAWATDWALGRVQGGRTIRPVSAWTQVFKRDCPRDHDAYARVRLQNGVVYSGLVANFSSDLEVEGRELVLAQPLASKTGTGRELIPVPSEYERVVIRGNAIEVMSVEYRPRAATQPAPKRKRTRKG